MRRLIFVLVVTGFFSIASAPFVHADEAAVLSKLENVEKSQTQILQELDEIKAELQIVKIRASLQS